ncbi:hypothetical protein HUE98_08110 [Candidatus Contubernalis alkalaceticus]|nr:DUF6609 family protein [Candidatus Contubernalis alkalaceticus]UNC92062.1 hypothetical protein HUE98_08110 [Candidatus Contubernalis alkalaceticus]
MLIGSVLVLATLVGGSFELNPFVFMIGYGLSLYVTELNPYVKRKYSLKGEMNSLQKKMAKYGDISLFPLVFIMGGSFISSGDWRMVWLGTLLATGIHFLLFIPVHGRVMLYLSILCSIIPIAGIFFANTPFLVFGLLDGVVKISFGLYMFYRWEAYLAGNTSFAEQS